MKHNGHKRTIIESLKETKDIDMIRNAKLRGEQRQIIAKMAHNSLNQSTGKKTHLRNMCRRTTKTGGPKVSRSRPYTKCNKPTIKAGITQKMKLTDT